MTSTSGKYLTFAPQGESYGIDVLKVREIIRHIAITAMPQMPAHIRGVINLRGKIIPVMDLRLRFGFPGVADNDLTCIIVVQVTTAGQKVTLMGLMVDGVEEVLNLNAADIEEPPNFGGQTGSDYILGMAKIRDRVKALLDIDRVAGTSVLQDATAW